MEAAASSHSMPPLSAAPREPNSDAACLLPPPPPQTPLNSDSAPPDSLPEAWSKLMRRFLIAVAAHGSLSMATHFIRSLRGSGPAAAKTRAAAPPRPLASAAASFFESRQSLSFGAFVVSYGLLYRLANKQLTSRNLSPALRGALAGLAASPAAALLAPFSDSILDPSSISLHLLAGTLVLIGKRRYSAETMSRTATAAFVASCTLLLYSWFFHPLALSRDYRSWISRMADMDPRLLELLRGLKDGSVRYGEHSHCMDAYCVQRGIAPARGDVGNGFIVCNEIVHPGESCAANSARRTARGFAAALLLYGPVHCVSQVIGLLGLRAARKKAAAAVAVPATTTSTSAATAVHAPTLSSATAAVPGESAAAVATLAAVSDSGPVLSAADCGIAAEGARTTAQSLAPVQQQQRQQQQQPTQQQQLLPYLLQFLKPFVPAALQTALLHQRSERALSAVAAVTTASSDSRAATGAETSGTTVLASATASTLHTSATPPLLGVTRSEAPFSAAEAATAGDTLPGPSPSATIPLPGLSMTDAHGLLGLTFSDVTLAASKAGIGALRSSAFLGSFIGLVWAGVCGHRNACGNDIPRGPLFASFLSGWAILLEHRRRRPELAVYVAPRALQTAWVLLRQRGWVRSVPGSSLMISAVASVLLMSLYEDDKAAAAISSGSSGAAGSGASSKAQQMHASSSFRSKVEVGGGAAAGAPSPLILTSSTSSSSSTGPSDAEDSSSSLSSATSTCGVIGGATVATATETCVCGRELPPLLPSLTQQSSCAAPLSESEAVDSSLPAAAAEHVAAAVTIDSSADSSAADMSANVASTNGTAVVSNYSAAAAAVENRVIEAISGGSSTNHSHSNSTIGVSISSGGGGGGSESTECCSGDALLRASSSEASCSSRIAPSASTASSASSVRCSSCGSTAPHPSPAAAASASARSTAASAASSSPALGAVPALPLSAVAASSLAKLKFGAVPRKPPAMPPMEVEVGTTATVARVSSVGPAAAPSPSLPIVYRSHSRSRSADGLSTTRPLTSGGSSSSSSSSGGWGEATSPPAHHTSPSHYAQQLLQQQHGTHPAQHSPPRALLLLHAAEPAPSSTTSSTPFATAMAAAAAARSVFTTGGSGGGSNPSAASADVSRNSSSSSLRTAAAAAAAFARGSGGGALGTARSTGLDGCSEAEGSEDDPPRTRGASPPDMDGAVPDDIDPVSSGLAMDEDDDDGEEGRGRGADAGRLPPLLRMALDALLST